MTAPLTRVAVRPGARMLLGIDPYQYVEPPTVPLHGSTDLRGEVVSVRLDDGRELLIARKDLEADHG